MENSALPRLERGGRMAGLDLGFPARSGDAQLIATLRHAMERRASDVHLVVGLPPVFRIDGDLITSSLPPLNREEVREQVYSLLTEGQQQEFEQNWELCVSLFLPELGHFRLTVYYHMSNVEASIRVCPLSLRTPDELGLPPAIYKLVERRSGLILITGPTGSGKTTTFNCLLDLINRQRRCKIITVEDPVEFVHQNRLSIIVQQQVHADTRSFSQALVHILRQDPDVIGVGEMRDLETIATALTAAETGHLVIATLHTPDAAQTVDRIIDAFPGDRQSQVLTQLASSLQGIIAQHLLPRVDQEEGRVLASEVLIATVAVRSQIRERKMNQLRSTIEMSKSDGMHLMDRSLRDLYQQGVITYDTAIAHAHSPETIQQTVAPPPPPRPPHREASRLREGLPVDSGCHRAGRSGVSGGSGDAASSAGGQGPGLPLATGKAARLTQPVKRFRRKPRRFASSGGCRIPATPASIVCPRQGFGGAGANKRQRELEGDFVQ